MNSPFLTNNYLVAGTRPGRVLRRRGRAGRAAVRGRRRAGPQPDARPAHPPPRRSHRSSSTASRTLPGHPGAHPSARTRARAGRHGHLEPGDALEIGGLRVRAIHTPGHTARDAGARSSTGDLFTGDTLFRARSAASAPGSTSFADLRHSVMEVSCAPRASAILTRAHGADHGRPRSRVRTPSCASGGASTPRAPPCAALGEPGDAVLLGRRLRRRPQGLGALARRPRRHRPGLEGRDGV